MNKSEDIITIKYIILAMIVTCIVSFTGNVGHAYSKTVGSGKITIQNGKVYRLKHFSRSIYKSSNIKIVSVTKKGIIKANKCGKCIVKVIRNKKIIKKFTVKVVSNNKAKHDSETPRVSPCVIAQFTPSPTEYVQMIALPTQTPEVTSHTATPKPVDRGYLRYSGLIINRIEAVNEDTSRVYFIGNDKKERNLFNNYLKDGVVFIVVDVPNKELEGYSLGDPVAIISGPYKYEIKGDSMFLDFENNIMSISSDKDSDIHYETPEPTQVP